MRPVVGRYLPLMSEHHLHHLARDLLRLLVVERVVELRTATSTATSTRRRIRRRCCRSRRCRCCRRGILGVAMLATHAEGHGERRA